ncbi:MAG: hypothetical protein R2789_14620 [Microthrixaceae bacterium]
MPELTRAGTERRGEAILTEEEAWEVMSVGGGILDAGFEVEVPRAGRTPRPSLRLTTLDGESASSPLPSWRTCDGRCSSTTSS